MIEAVIPSSQKAVGEAHLPLQSLSYVPEDMDFISRSFWTATSPRLAF